MRLAIGIDLGGTGTYGALVNQEGTILADLERKTPAEEGPAAVIAMMMAMVRDLLAMAPAPVLGIGLGITGLMERESGLSIYAPNIAGWRNIQVLEPFRREFGLPVAMDNDVRVGCLGELHFGAGRRFRNFLFTTLGTGIGGAIVLDRQLYRGPYNTAGEFGHIPVRPDGSRGGGERCGERSGERSGERCDERSVERSGERCDERCGCGATGCLEALASGPAIRRRTLRALAEHRDAERSILWTLPQAQITAKALAEAARSGDALALALWAEVGRDLGLGIATYYNLLGPDAVIVGGGVSLAGELLLEPARQVCAERLMPGIRERVAIVAAELGDEAGAIGAATLVKGLVSE